MGSSVRFSLRSINRNFMRHPLPSRMCGLYIDDTNTSTGTYVKNDKRSACRHKAATVLPNRTAAT